MHLPCRGGESLRAITNPWAMSAGTSVPGRFNRAEQVVGEWPDEMVHTK